MSTAASGWGIDGAPTSSYRSPVLRAGVLLLSAVLALIGWQTSAGRGPAMSAGILVLVAGLPATVGLGPRWCRWSGRRRGRASGVRLPADGALAAAARVDTVVLDDATAVTGRLRIAVTEPQREGDERNLRWFGGALGHAADDEIGRALARGAPRGRLGTVVSHPGQGFAGSVDRHPVRVGTPAWIGHGTADRPPLPGTTVAVEVDGRLLGRLGLVAEVRPEAVTAMSRLAHLGITPVLVSAGAADDAARLATDLGDLRWEAPLDGAGRAELVASLGGTVAYAAPSVADAPPGTVPLEADRIDLAVAALELARAVHTRSVVADRVTVTMAAAVAVLAVAAPWAR